MMFSSFLSDMTNKEFELKFLPTKACLEARVSQEFSTDTDYYYFAYFTDEREETEEEEEIKYRKMYLGGDRYLWENSASDFLELQTGNTIAASFEFSGFPEIKQNAIAPGDDILATDASYISFQLNADKLPDAPNDANGIFLYGSTAMYAGIIEPETINLFPLLESFSGTEKLAWESIFLGAFTSGPDLQKIEGTDDLGYLNLSNSDAWLLASSDIELLEITTTVSFDSAGYGPTLFENIILERSGSHPALLGGIFLSTGSNTDDLILYASPFYTGNKEDSIEVETVLSVSAEFLTDIIII